MDKFVNLLLWLTVIIWLFIWSAWVWLGKDVFEIGQAFTIFGFTLGWLVYKKNWLITRISFAIALNQLADELFFNPFVISWNEYIIMCVVMLLIFSRFYKVNISAKYTKKQNV